MSIGSLIIQFITGFVFKFKPLFWDVFRAIFLTYLSIIIIGAVIGFALGFSGYHDVPYAVRLLILVIGFLLQAYFYGVFIQNIEEGSIGFRKGLILSLVLLVIGIAIIITIGLLDCVVTR